MKSIRTLTIALASLIAMPALAQDATTDTTSDAASKRFAVASKKPRGHATLNQPI